MSRDLIVTENITLDGVIDATEGWFDVSGDAGRADMSEVEQQHRDSADAVLLGRLTFEQFAGYWPEQTDDTTGVTDYLNRTQKYVGRPGPRCPSLRRRDGHAEAGAGGGPPVHLGHRPDALPPRGLSRRASATVPGRPEAVLRVLGQHEPAELALVARDGGLPRRLDDGAPRRPSVSTSDTRTRSGSCRTADGSQWTVRRAGSSRTTELPGRGS
jgi:hypothetical protein